LAVKPVGLRAELHGLSKPLEFDHLTAVTGPHLQRYCSMRDARVMKKGLEFSRPFVLACR
jgi:hypothetical protein